MGERRIAARQKRQLISDLAEKPHSKRYLLRISAPPLFPAIFDTVTHCAANDETIFASKSQQMILDLVARRTNKGTNAPVQLIPFRIEN